jgi:DNA-binding response OmpR family regulator
MKTILYLEDEEIIGSIYKKNFEKAGYKVDWEQTSEGALKAAKNKKYNFVALDQALKEDVSGMDILPDIRKAQPKAKIVMLSNFSQFQMEAKAKELGADGYLVKINTTPQSFIEFIKTL